MNETGSLWPRTDSCEMCGNDFERYRPQHRFCKSNGCKKLRQRQRWFKWRDARIQEGNFRERINRQQQAYRQRTGYGRDWELRKKYGITLDQWLQMVADAVGVCEICGLADESLCVDHSHKTGKVRGVLCRRCNRSIGQLGDDAGMIRKALAYLERSDA